MEKKSNTKRRISRRRYEEGRKIERAKIRKEKEENKYF